MNSVKISALAVLFLYVFIQSAYCQVIIVSQSATPQYTNHYQSYPGYVYTYGDARTPAGYYHVPIVPTAPNPGPTVIIDMSSGVSGGWGSSGPGSKMVIEHILDWLMPSK